MGRSWAWLSATKVTICRRAKARPAAASCHCIVSKNDWLAARTCSASCRQLEQSGGICFCTHENDGPRQPRGASPPAESVAHSPQDGVGDFHWLASGGNCRRSVRVHLVWFFSQPRSAVSLPPVDRTGQSPHAHGRAQPSSLAFESVRSAFARRRRICLDVSTANATGRHAPPYVPGRSRSWNVHCIAAARTWQEDRS